MPQHAIGNTIRAATAQDIAVVARLEEQWARSADIIGMVPAPIDVLESHVDGCFFVAERDGEIVGFVYGQTKRNEGTMSAVMPLEERYLEIDGLYVLPGYRSDGLVFRPVSS